MKTDIYSCSNKPQSFYVNDYALVVTLIKRVSYFLLSLKSDNKLTMA